MHPIHTSSLPRGDASNLLRTFQQSHLYLCLFPLSAPAYAADPCQLLCHEQSGEARLSCWGRSWRHLPHLQHKSKAETTWASGHLASNSHPLAQSHRLLQWPNLRDRNPPKGKSRGFHSFHVAVSGSSGSEHLESHGQLQGHKVCAFQGTHHQWADETLSPSQQRRLSVPLSPLSRCGQRLERWCDRVVPMDPFHLPTQNQYPHDQV